MARKKQPSANTETTQTHHNPQQKSHHLKLRIDDLKVFEPLTEN
jgi:hypothetical protein